MNRQGLVITILILGCMGNLALAELPPIAIAAKADTFGLGGDLIIGLGKNVNARLGLGGIDLDTDFELDDIDYDAGIDLFAYSAALDWYPFSNSFFISGGVVFPDIEAELSATPSGTVNIGGTDYDASLVDVGTLNGRLTNDTDVAPYIGIGWGNATNPNKRFGLLASLGVAFTEASEVTLTTTGSAVTAAHLAQENQKINDDLEDWKIYPVASLSLYFRF